MPLGHLTAFASAARDRAAALRCGLSWPRTALAAQPEAAAAGSARRGARLLEGALPFAGGAIGPIGADFWRAGPRSREFTARLHGFEWLDDLAAAGGPRAGAAAQALVAAWIALHGRGFGPGWSAEIAGQRLTRWIGHSGLLLDGLGEGDRLALFESMGRQTDFLRRRWRSAGRGLPRFRALCGLARAGLSLEGMDGHLDEALGALDRSCIAWMEAPPRSRNPEELLETLLLLARTAEALGAAGRAVPGGHAAALRRGARRLRGLRHADGALARFHGGGRGLEGDVDRILAAAGAGADAPDGPMMGFVRMRALRTSVVVDAAPPPGAGAPAGAHASTLAFELTSGRRPIVIGCGPGREFGPDWRIESRRTRRHSTLVLADRSSARLAAGPGGVDALAGGPRSVPVEIDRVAGAERLQASHDGYVREFGLTHMRRLELGVDGRRLAGEDWLVARSNGDARRHAKAVGAGWPDGIPFDIRFHLHPEVQAQAQADAVRMWLRSGEVWELRVEGAETVRIERSAYLDSLLPDPVETRQVVLSGRAAGRSVRVGWELAMSEATPTGLADLAEGGIDSPAGLAG